MSALQTKIEALDIPECLAKEFVDWMQISKDRGKAVVQFKITSSIMPPAVRVLFNTRLKSPTLIELRKLFVEHTGITLPLSKEDKPVCFWLSSPAK